MSEIIRATFGPGVAKQEEDFIQYALRFGYAGTVYHATGFTPKWGIEQSLTWETVRDWAQTKQFITLILQRYDEAAAYIVKDNVAFLLDSRGNISMFEEETESDFEFQEDPLEALDDRIGDPEAFE